MQYRRVAFIVLIILSLLFLNENTEVLANNQKPVGSEPMQAHYTTPNTLLSASAVMDNCDDDPDSCQPFQSGSENIGVWYLAPGDCPCKWQYSASAGETDPWELVRDSNGTPIVTQIEVRIVRGTKTLKSVLTLDVDGDTDPGDYRALDIHGKALDLLYEHGGEECLTLGTGCEKATIDDRRPDTDQNNG